jgi:hypothetical protein
MPSPFPGMDPYLEGDLWTTLQSQLAAEIARQLAPRLRPRYVALAMSRSEVEPADNGRSYELGTPAVTAPLTSELVMHGPMPSHFVEIWEVATRSLVTDIELLSPADKHGDGWRDYVARRGRLLMSNTHLLEIDLLREGRRMPLKGKLPSLPYYCLLSRAGTRPNAEVWPVAFDHPLPILPVPLLDGEPDLPLDVQAALNAVYDINGYDLLVDYTQPPPGPMPAEVATWADKLMRAAGLRP